MNFEFDFNKLKESIEDLDLKEQQKRLIKARTEYLQNVPPKDRELFEVNFDEKCDLEILKIKELEKLT